MTLETPKTRTQKDLLREALLRGEELTPLDALDRMGCFRLASRIHDLKQEGMDIVSRKVKTPGGAIVNSYSLRTHQYGFEEE